MHGSKARNLALDPFISFSLSHTHSLSLSPSLSPSLSLSLSLPPSPSPSLSLSLSLSVQVHLDEMHLREIEAGMLNKVHTNPQPLTPNSLLLTPYP